MPGFSTVNVGIHNDTYHQGNGSVQTHAAVTATHGQATIEGIAGSQAKVDTHAGANVNGTVHPNAERVFPDNQFLSINIALGG